MSEFETSKNSNLSEEIDPPAVDQSKPHYKLWIDIEYIDEENDIYDNQGMPVSVGVTTTMEQAEEIQNLLKDFAIDVLPDEVIDYLTNRLV